MKINLDQNKEKIEKEIKSFIQSVLLVKFPYLGDSSTILVAGSVATNTFDINSDIDLHIIRSENLEKDKLQELKAYKNKLLDEDSNIELRFARTYETLEQYLNWNDDYILGEFQNSLIIQDAGERFSKLLSKFVWYPDDIYANKVKFLLSENTTIIEKELPNAIARNNRFYMEALRVKFIRYCLTLVRLLNRKFPVYDKKLYETTLQFLKNTEVEKILDNLVNKTQKETALNEYKILNKLLTDEVITKTGLTDLNKESLLSFSTKDKILFE